MQYVPDKFLSIVLLTIPQASDKLPTQHHPQEVGWWFHIGRRLYGRKNIPVISSIDEFEAQWIQWWSGAQPKGRDVGRWPFSQGETTGDWGKLLSGGKDGLFLIVMSLGWWAHAVRKLDLSHLCFSLNFYSPMFLRLFPSMFPLLTYSQSLFFLIC